MIFKSTVFSRLTLFIFLTFHGFSYAQTRSDNLRAPTIKASEIKNFELTSGVFDTGLEMTNGDLWNMKINIPSITKNTKLPLVIALHWAGGPNTYKEYSTCLAFPAFEGFEAIIVAPSSDSRHWIEPGNEKRVIDLIKKLTKYWPVDFNKIIITGYSNGGIGSWYYSQKHPKLFAASLPIAGYFEKEQNKVPQYILHGEKDELFRASQIKTAINYSINKGSRITYKIIKNYSHFMGCAYVVELKKMIGIMKKEQF